jgi:hypothetical protein
LSTSQEEDETNSSNGISDDIELLLGEIEIMQTETEDIVALITKSKFAKYPRLQSIRKQLHHLQTVNANLRTRAEALIRA